MYTVLEGVINSHKFVNSVFVSSSFDRQLDTRKQLVTFSIRHFDKFRMLSNIIIEKDN